MQASCARPQHQLANAGTGYESCQVGLLNPMAGIRSGNGNTSGRKCGHSSDRLCLSLMNMRNGAEEGQDKLGSNICWHTKGGRWG